MFEVPGNWDSIMALLVLVLPNLVAFKQQFNTGKEVNYELELIPYVFARKLRLQISSPQSAHYFESPSRYRTVSRKIF